MPFADNLFEGFVLTFVFSAIPDGTAALREMQRVLCPKDLLAPIDADEPSDGNVPQRKEYGAFHSLRMMVARKQ
jgi:ubiquinone/menaquinone biosynthesis C-methylase UbiE